MTHSVKLLSFALLAVSLAVVCPNQAQAQYPTAVTTTTVQAPRMVGYQAEPYGLFGLRTSWRPVYTPPTTVTVTRPAVPVAAPTAVYYSAPVLTPAPVALPTPVYYSAPAPVALPTVTLPTTTTVAYPTPYLGL